MIVATGQEPLEKVQMRENRYGMLARTFLNENHLLE